MEPVTGYGAIRVICERPDYHLFTNNCQTFTHYFATAIIENPLLPDSLETLVNRWVGLFKLPSGNEPATLPGTFPELPIPEEALDDWQGDASIRSDGNILTLVQRLLTKNIAPNTTWTFDETRAGSDESKNFSQVGVRCRLDSRLSIIKVDTESDQDSEDHRER